MSKSQSKPNPAIAAGGWYGVLAILTAYALLNFNILTVHNLIYQLLNITGALALMTEAYSKKDYQPVALNIVWAIIALIAILHLAI